MKLRWIGISGMALILTALILGSLGPWLWPSASWMQPGNGMMGGGMGMMNDGMMGGGMMNAGVADFNAPFDQRFLDQMIVHHQSAVMSSQMMIVDSARPELRDLAQRIISAQQRESNQMGQWRMDWYGATNGGPMPGMMGAGMMDGATNRDQMRKMMGANADVDRLFLQMMIPHHEAAIVMAQNALEQAQHPEIKTLAQTIITTQQAEITEMQGYLQAWYGAH